MILYLSEPRIDNLYMEQSIKRPGIVNMLRAIKKVEVTVDKVGVSGEFNYPNSASDRKITKVLSSLKNKKQIINLGNKKHIFKMKYYYCYGTLSTDNDFRSNYQDDFHANDVIGFNVEIQNDYYDRIHINCSVSNLKTLCRCKETDTRWVYYIGSGPNIFYKSTEVEMIFIVESVDENSGVIDGVPIIICAGDKKWLEAYV